MDLIILNGNLCIKERKNKLLILERLKLQKVIFLQNFPKNKLFCHFGFLLLRWRSQTTTKVKKSISETDTWRIKLFFWKGLLKWLVYLDHLFWLESNTIGAVNNITLGQIMSDHNKQMITLTGFPFLLNKPAPLDLIQLAQSDNIIWLTINQLFKWYPMRHRQADHNNHLITLTSIALSGFHCTMDM